MPSGAPTGPKRPSRKSATRAFPPVIVARFCARRPFASALGPWQLMQIILKMLAPGVCMYTGASGGALATSIQWGRAEPVNDDTLGGTGSTVGGTLLQD